MKQPSNPKLKSLDTALRQAKRDARAGQSDVTAASSTRLAQLMALPAYQRVDKLDDADLEPAERDALVRSVRAALRPPLAKRLLSPGIFARLDNLLPTVGLRTMVALAALLFASAYAMGKNAEAAVLFGEGEFRLLRATGALSWEILPAGRQVAITQRNDGTANIRVWMPREGYATATLHNAVLRVLR